jgi:hypothetical protein
VLNLDGQNQIATTDDVEAFIRGLTLFGTGGGGLPWRGRQFLNGLLDDGIEIRWTPDEELADDDMTACVFGMGSIAPHEPMSEERRAKAGYSDVMEPRPAVRAVRRLGDYLGVTIQAVIAFEMGAWNTVVAIDTALRLGIAVIDGDYTGRAMPEMAQCLPSAYGLSCCPMVICDPWGIQLALERVPNPDLAERVGKAVSTVTKAPDVLALCAHAGFAQTVGECRATLVRGSFSRSLRIGRALVAAERAGDDVIEVAAEVCQGKVLFRGTVSDKDWDDQAGYMVGTTLIVGDGEFAGAQARVWFKNENHVLWIDESVRATSPDLICLINSERGEPRTNTELEEGEQVGVIGLVADERLRSGPALERSRPDHYDLDIGYVPVA